MNVCEKVAPENGYFHPGQNDLINKSDINRRENSEKSAIDDNLSVISVSCDTDFREVNNGNSVLYIFFFKVCYFKLWNFFLLNFCFY